MDIARFAAELKRRKVWQVTAIYVAVSLGVIEAATNVLPRLTLPDWTVTFVVVLTILGLPIALALAWTYDITRGGIERTTASAEAPHTTSEAESQAITGPGLDGQSGPAASAPERSRRRPIIYAAIALVIAVAGGALAFPHVFGGSGTDRRPEIHSLAVLPLEDYAQDSTQAYFADGMTEALISELSHIRALKKVISRTSVMEYKGTHKRTPQIARELGVDGIVEGSVMHAEGRVRITAQLIFGPGDQHLWSNDYERDLKNVLSLQSEVARAIAREIQVQLEPEEQARLAQERRPVDPDAYDAYLKGRHELWRFTDSTTARAVEHLGESVRLDSTYAPAHAWLGEAYGMLGYMYGDINAREGFRRGRAEAERALQLDPQLADAHMVLGEVLWLYDWNWDAAERELREAIEVDPNSAMAHGALGYFLGTMRHSDELESELARAMELDPMSLETRSTACQALVEGGLFERGIAECRHMLALDSASGRARQYLEYADEGLGRFDEAIETVAGRWSLSDSSSAARDSIATLRRAYTERGPRGYYETLFEWWGRMDRASWWSARLLAQLGRADELLPILEDWYEQRRGEVAFLRTWHFDPVRDDPRFQAFLKKVGLD